MEAADSMHRRLVLASLTMGFLAGALACALAYWMIGSTIDDHGILREPFFLIPLAELLLVLGVLFGGFYLFAHLRARLSRRRAQVAAKEVPRGGT
jgi:uncharacterized membrane protein